MAEMKLKLIIMLQIEKNKIYQFISFFQSEPKSAKQTDPNIAKMPITD